MGKELAFEEFHSRKKQIEKEEISIACGWRLIRLALFLDKF